MDFKSAEEYLMGFVSYENFAKIPYGQEAFNLQKLKDFGKAYGVDYSKLKIFHVGGSKGKGSVSNMIAAYLREKGLIVGLFTSPFMYSVRECFDLNGKEISEEDFALLVEDLKWFLSKNQHFELTYFELLTILVLKFFVAKRCDYVVLEVGLGGRLDTTNIVNPLVSIITRIEKEHADILGPHLRNIVAEKFGILRDGVPVFIGYQSRYVLGLMKGLLGGKREVCFVNDLMKSGSIEEQNFTLVKAVLSSTFEDFDNGLLVKAVNDLKLPLRGEVREFRGRKVVLDMAHTKDSIAGLLERLGREFPGKELVFLVSILKGKQFRSILKRIEAVAEKIVVTASHPVRSIAPEVLARVVKAEVALNPEEAFEDLIKQIKKDQVLVVTGSHFLAAQIAKIMQ